MLKRSKENPILKPNRRESWEAEAAFNGCPIKKGKNIHLLYRAISLPHYHATAQIKMRVSDIGIADSKDGINFTNRRKLIVPYHPWERYGCEDPRITKIRNKYYIFYTALSHYPFTAEGIKVGLAISRDLKSIDQKYLITPFNAKAMSLFPEKIKGKMTAILTANTDRPPSKIAIAYFNKEEDMWSDSYWENWLNNLDKHTLNLQRRPQDHVEVGGPPIKTSKGWLLVYAYIKNYFTPKKLFTIEAALLDLKDPTKVIARTDLPLLVPEEEYERYGIVPDTIFPSGTMVHKGDLYVYYGATDTTCCLATIKLSSLINSMLTAEKNNGRLTRYKENPIIKPDKENSWESKAVFNPAAFYEAGKVHIVYRAMSKDNTSVMGYATSKDGLNIDYRSSSPIYVPREEFEQKLIPGGNSGCEDPRITKIGNDLYMCYTAFDGKHPPRIALSSIPLKSFLKGQYQKWTKPVLLSPPEFDNKDACVFPEKIKGKYLIIHRFGDDIDTAPVSDLNFKKGEWLEEHRWILPRKGMWDNKKLGIAAPPLKTKKGWILLYHGVSAEDNHYRVGAVLLDIKDPTKIIGRTGHPILEPTEEYEKVGQIPNVVFPCGAVIIKNTIFVYYGGGDSVVGVATVKVDKLLNELQKEI